MKTIRIQPIPYQGSKRNIASKIMKFAPSKIERLVEPFAGSGAISLYSAYHDISDNFLLNDSYPPLMKLWELIISNPIKVIDGYKKIWNDQLDSPYEYFFEIRDQFNKDQDPIKFLYLQARCVKNALRFNSSGEFNQSPDKRRLGRKPDLMSKHINSTHNLLKNRTKIFSGDYSKLLNELTKNDLVYMDPPYLGTSTGKNPRYYEQLNLEEFINFLYELNTKQVPFILSFDGNTGDKNYMKPLPNDLNLSRVEINAGRSAQATLNGRSAQTTESLYLSAYLN